MKLFIIGPSGSGKTTIAKRISSSLSIEATNLDDLFWINTPNSINTKRSNEERTELLNRILKKDKWIIEGAYVEWPLPAMKEADYIIHLNTPGIILTKRIWIRFLKRKMRIEQSNKKENINSVMELIKWNRTQIGLIDKRVEKLEETGKAIIRIKRTNEICKLIRDIKKVKAF